MREESRLINIKNKSAILSNKMREIYSRQGSAERILLAKTSLNGGGSFSQFSVRNDRLFLEGVKAKIPSSGKYKPREIFLVESDTKNNLFEIFNPIFKVLIESTPENTQDISNQKILYTLGLRGDINKLNLIEEIKKLNEKEELAFPLEETREMYVNCEEGALYLCSTDFDIEISRFISESQVRWFQEQVIEALEENIFSDLDSKLDQLENEINCLNRAIGEIK